MAKTSQEDVCKIVKCLVDVAEDYRDERSCDRVKAMVYYDGDAKAMQEYIPADENRSSFVSRDVRATIKKAIPSITRTILGNDEIVEYQPIAEGDEETAEQATDYMNYVVVPECGAAQAIHDAIDDAVKLRNGILKWYYEEKKEVKVSLHTGLDEMSLYQLVEPDTVEVLEHTQRFESIKTPEGTQEVPVHDVRIRRIDKINLPRLKCIAPENFLIHPDAVNIEDSPIVGEKCKLRRSDLVEMGYDKAKVWQIPACYSDDTEEEIERDLRRRDVEQNKEAPQKSLEEVDYFDLLVRVDADGDGIAELRHMVFAGSIKPEYLLLDEEWDDVHYASIVSESRPHQWEGNSITDDVMDIQDIKTFLARQTLDNLMWQNNPQPVFTEGMLVNPEAAYNPQFGLPIRVEAGVNVREALQWNLVPMVADKSYSMLEYMDRVIQERTGISDASSGMASDALQNMTAKASSMVEQAGIGQTELMVRTIANCLKPVFRGLLKLIIQHQDKPRTVRLRDKWVTFDPRTWNASMDAVVNVGLGAGTRERDMMAMQQVIALQAQILTQMGASIGGQFVTPQNIYNAMSKLIQAAGLRTTGLYITQPEDEAIQQALQAQSQQPSPEEIKAQSAMRLKQIETQGKMQIEEFKAQIKERSDTITSQLRMAEVSANIEKDMAKERAQMDADLTTELQKISADAEARMEEAILKAQTEREKQDSELQRDLIKQDTEFAWMDTQERISDKKIASDVARAQMSEAGKAMGRQRMPDGNRAGRNGK